MALYGIKDNKSFEELYPRSKLYTQEEVDNLLAYYGQKTALTSRGGYCLYDAVNNIAGVFESIDAIQEAVTNGDFSNIYTEDYILVNISTTYKANEIVKLVVADFDYYLNRGNTAVTNHHLILIPESSLETPSGMNSSDTASGGYKNSAIHTTILPIYATALSTALGGHLLTIPHLISQSVNTSAVNNSGGITTGASNAYGWDTTSVILPSEIQVYGSIVWSQGFDIGEAFRQLSYFALRPDKIVACLGYYGKAFNPWWLSGVASSTAFCRVTSRGEASYYHASYRYGVRPLIIFG